MQEHREQIEALGAKPLGISVGAAYQAAGLMNDTIPFDLLVDPDQNFKTATLQFKKVKLWTYALPTVWWRYLKWALKVRQGKITASLTEPPGVAIVDTEQTIRYLYQGETLGDYPPIGEVLDALRGCAGR